MHKKLDIYVLINHILSETKNKVHYIVEKYIANIKVSAVITSYISKAT